MLDLITPIRAIRQSHSHYSQFSTRPLNGAIGALVEHLDLSKPLCSEAIENIHHALKTHMVLVFRDQNLTPAQLCRIGAYFGELHVNPFVKGVQGCNEVIEIRSEENHEKQFTGLWHSDISWSETPSMGSLLYAVQLPEYGGDTLFGNMVIAYEALSDGYKKLLAELRAEHRVDRFHRAKGEFGDVPDGVIHPVVRTHPETEQKALFVNEYFTTRFEGMSEAESQPILDYLFRHCARPDFCCRVQWQPGTLVFWDNRCTQHCATNDYAGQPRLMHRVTITGDAPY